MYLEVDSKISDEEIKIFIKEALKMRENEIQAFMEICGRNNYTCNAPCISKYNIN